MSEYSQPSETSSLNLDLIDADIQRCQDFLSRNELSMQQSNQILQKSNMMSQKNPPIEQKYVSTPSSNKNTVKNVLNSHGNQSNIHSAVEKRPTTAPTAKPVVQNKVPSKSNNIGLTKNRPQSAGFSSQQTHTNIRDHGNGQITQHALSTNDPQFLLRSQSLQQKIQEEYENLPGSRTVQRRQGEAIQKTAQQIQNQAILDQQSFQPIIDNEQEDDNNDLSIQQMQNVQYKNSQSGTSQFNQRLALQQGEKLTDFAMSRLGQKKSDKYAFGSRIDNHADQMKRSRPEPHKSRQMIEIEEQQRNKEKQENTGKPKVNTDYNAEHQIRSKYNQVDYRQIMEKREQERAQREKKNMMNHSYTPNIGNSMPLSKSLYVGNKLMPFEERQRVYSEKSLEKRNKIAEDRQREMKIQSTPKTSNSNLYNRYQDKNFLERLQIYDQEKREKLTQLQMKEDDNFKTQPYVSPGNDKLLANIGMTFEERQQFYRQQKNAKISELQQRYGADVQVNTKSHETVQDACMRLYKQTKKSQKQPEIDNQCTFKPEIDVNSNMMARQKPKLQEHAIEIQREIQRKKDLEIERKQQQELEQFTFKPQLSELSKAVMPHFRFDDTKNLMNQIKTEKEYRERKQQDQKREQEMRSLTQNQEFVSKTKMGAIDQKIFQPVKINGIDKVRERQEKIKQQKQELKDRELAVFGTFCQPFNENENTEQEKNKKPQKTPPTIVQPFELTKRLERSAKKEKMYVSRDEYQQTHQWIGEEDDFITSSKPTNDTTSKLLYQTGPSVRSQVSQKQLNTKNLVEAMMRVEL